MSGAVAIEVTGEGLGEILRRCNAKKPKDEDLRALREQLDRLPQLWRLAGDMGEVAARRMIEGINGSPLTIESVKVGRLAMRRELGYDAASPLEKMLIDHTVLCWLRLQLAEYNYTGVMSENHTLTLGEYWEKRLSGAQRRYLRACETLARIRRLALPALQVNIGEKQVNLTGR